MNHTSITLDSLTDFLAKAGRAASTGSGDIVDGVDESDAESRVRKTKQNLKLQLLNPWTDLDEI